MEMGISSLFKIIGRNTPTSLTLLLVASGRLLGCADLVFILTTLVLVLATLSARDRVPLVAPYSLLLEKELGAIPNTFTTSAPVAILNSPLLYYAQVCLNPFFCKNYSPCTSQHRHPTIIEK